MGRSALTFMTCVQMFMVALLEVAVVRITSVAGLVAIYDVLFVEWIIYNWLPKIISYWVALLS